MQHTFCTFLLKHSQMTSKDDQFALAYAEYFMILATIKERCDKEDALLAQDEESALQGGSLFPNQRHNEHTP